MLFFVSGVLGGSFFSWTSLVDQTVNDEPVGYASFDESISFSFSSIMGFASPPRLLAPTLGQLVVWLILRIVGLALAVWVVVLVSKDVSSGQPKDVDYLRRVEELEEKRRLAEIKADEANEDGSSARAEVLEVEAELSRAEPPARFQAEQQAAARASTLTFFVGLVVAGAVVIVGLSEWVGVGVSASDGPVETTTTDALARVAVVAASFYLAGQLFLRSTSLNIRSQEFRRAAIAMEIVDRLADTLMKPEDQSAFRRRIYEHHLTGNSTKGEQSAAPDTLVSFLDEFRKTQAR